MLRRPLLRLALGYLLLFIGLVIILGVAGALDRAAVAIAALSLAAALVVGAGLILATFRPLRQFVQAARAIASGDLSRRVGAEARVGVRELADAFNQMAGSLEELVAAAAQERSRLVAALNSSADAVMAVDRDGGITFANVAAEQLFQRSQQELVGHPFAWVLPDEQVVKALRSSREEGRRQATLLERPNRQYLRAITTPIVGGGAWAALAVLHDLTDVRRTEQVRRDFVANVSHELRTPLASVKSVIETLESGALDDPAAAREFLARANEEVDRLVQLVEEMLELSRIESGELPLAKQPVEMATVLQNAAERLRPQSRSRNVAIELEVALDIPRVIGDAARLERAAVNLIHNALQFTPAGGSVRVSAGLEEGAVVVKVSDTGAGIAKEDLPRVFERFYKADRARGGAGTGLGLAIVKHTVEAHGGAVSVESEEGRGSTFCFSIPVDSARRKR